MKFLADRISFHLLDKLFFSHYCYRCHMMTKYPFLSSFRYKFLALPMIPLCIIAGGGGSSHFNCPICSFHIPSSLLPITTYSLPKVGSKNQVSLARITSVTSYEVGKIKCKASFLCVFCKETEAKYTNICYS